MEVKGTIEVSRTAGDIFTYLAEPKNNTEWEKSLVETEMTSDGPMALGSKGRRVDKNFGSTDEGNWEVTKFEENKLLGFDFRSEKFVGYGEFALDPRESSTELSYMFEGRATSGFWNLIMPLMMPMFRSQVRKDFERLKGILESG